MSKRVIAGQLLEKVMTERDLSAFQLAKRMKVPPARVRELVNNKHGFGGVTLEKLAAAIPGYSIEWWQSMMELVKAGRLVSDDDS